MAKIYYDSDCDLRLLDGKAIGIVGFGSQGHAHAQNLRDSGCRVIVAEAKGTEGWKSAKAAGFDLMLADEMAKKADIIVMLAPDTLQQKIYHQSIEKGLVKGNTLMFAHGFNIHYGQIVPPANIDVIMIAPKCPGHMLRQLYTEGAGPPALDARRFHDYDQTVKVGVNYRFGWHFTDPDCGYSVAIFRMIQLNQLNGTGPELIIS